MIRDSQQTLGELGIVNGEVEQFGRPKGARNKISEKFLEALANHFEVHGEEAIDKVCQERPHDYLKIVASVLPKRVELDEAAEMK